MATVLIGPLAWETPYAMGVALKDKKTKKKKKFEYWTSQAKNFMIVYTEFPLMWLKVRDCSYASLDDILSYFYEHFFKYI